MVYNELCHKEIDWSKAMKQILIKLASLGLLFSVVSTYACDGCGCSTEASKHSFVPAVEGKGKKLHYVPVIREKSKDEKMNAGDDDGDVGAVFGG